MCRIDRIKESVKAGFFLHPAYPAHPVLTLYLPTFARNRGT
jgi:hypothetical protein